MTRTIVNFSLHWNGEEFERWGPSPFLEDHFFVMGSAYLSSARSGWVALTPFSTPIHFNPHWDPV